MLGNNFIDVYHESDLKLIRCGFFETFVIKNPKYLEIENLEKRNKRLWELIAPLGVITSIVRRVMPKMIAQDIIGVQPMTGPVGQIHTLRIRYSNKEDEE